MAYPNIRVEVNYNHPTRSYYKKGVNFTFALLLMAFTTDMVYLWIDGQFWVRLSIWILGAGVLMGSTLVMLEIMRTQDREPAKMREPGRLEHFGIIVATALASINCLMRIQDLQNITPWGLVLSVVAVAVLCVTLWLNPEGNDDLNSAEPLVFTQSVNHK